MWASWSDGDGRSLLMGSPLPAGDLVGGDVDPVPEVGAGDGEDACAGAAGRTPRSRALPGSISAVLVRGTPRAGSSSAPRSSRRRRRRGDARWQGRPWWRSWWLLRSGSVPLPRRRAGVVGDDPEGAGRVTPRAGGHVRVGSGVERSRGGADRRGVRGAVCGARRARRRGGGRGGAGGSLRAAAPSAAEAPPSTPPRTRCRSRA